MSARQYQFYVYIMTNQCNTVLYVGVTNSLARRIYEHKEKQSFHTSFTKKYNINKLVYYEIFDDINYAIAREKQLKGGSRNNKIRLINQTNPDWNDLSGDIYL